MEPIASGGNAHIQALFQKTPGAFLVLTPDFKIAAASDEYLKSVHKDESIVGHDLHEVFPETPPPSAALQRLAQLDQLKTKFFANVSHELRTPLTLILAFLDRQRKSTKLDEAETRSLQTAERNARTLLKHVNDLLDISRLEAGEVKPVYAPVDMARLVRRTAAHFLGLAQDHKYDFRITTPKNLLVELDADQIQRVFMNLLGNAFKFTPPGGEVYCRLDSSIQDEKAMAVFTVEDNGPGISEELSQSIFERFFQAEDSRTRTFEGTGLGLSIAKDFVDLHHGTIQVSRSARGGACFKVELPLRAPAGTVVGLPLEEFGEDEPLHARPEPPGPSRVSASVAAARETALPADTPLVLVVEDNPDMNEFICELLATEYRVARAFNGQEGLARAQALQPDLILTDFMMPQFGGEYLLKGLAGTPELKDVPVIMLTAKADDLLRVRLLSESAEDFIMKPFLPDELRTRVRNHIGHYRAKKLMRDELHRSSDNIEVLARDLAIRARELENLIKLKDEFLATISHELRTPMNVIQGFAEILHDNPQDPEVTLEASDAIYRNAQAQTKMITDLLDVSSIITGKMELEPSRFQLSSLLVAALASHEVAIKSKSLKLVTAWGPELGIVFGDSHRLQQVIWHLLSNAIKFTPPHGMISVSAERSGDVVRISVRDTGIGIAPEFLPHVFEHFRQQDGSLTRNYGGMGLGLSIGKNIAELHGGTLRALSAGVNQGAEFILEIPVGVRATKSVDSATHASPSTRQVQPRLEGPFGTATVMHRAADDLG